MPEEVKPNDVMEAVKKLRETIEKYGEESAEYKAAQEKTQEIIDKQEDQNQKLVAEIAKERKAREETDERIKELELEVAKAQENNKEDWRDSAAYKALNKYAQFGKEELNEEERKSLEDMKTKELRTDSDTAGGYLTFSELDNVIVKQITELSPVRQVARVRTTNQKTLEIPTRTGIPTATYEGETEAVADSESAYGKEQLTPVRLSTSIPYTWDLLQDSNFDLETEMKGDVAEAMAQKEGNKFVLGTGVKQPEGFTVNTTVVAAAVTSEAAGAVSAKDMTDLTGELKVGYNPMYAFNRKTLAYLRSLEDGAGNPIWQVNLRDGAPNTINGEPYILFNDMADIAAGSLSVVYADFMRGYTITDKAGMVVIRDEYTLKKQAMIELTFHKWNYGQVILPEAFVLLLTET